jgi:hypothetical protein
MSLVIIGFSGFLAHIFQKFPEKFPEAGNLRKHPQSLEAPASLRAAALPASARRMENWLCGSRSRKALHLLQHSAVSAP